MNEVYPSNSTKTLCKDMPLGAKIGDIFLCTTGGPRGHYFILHKENWGSCRLVDLSDGWSLGDEQESNKKELFSRGTWEKVTEPITINPCN